MSQHWRVSLHGLVAAQKDHDGLANAWDQIRAMSFWPCSKGHRDLFVQCLCPGTQSSRVQSQRLGDHQPFVTAEETSLPAIDYHGRCEWASARVERLAWQELHVPSLTLWVRRPHRPCCLCVQRKSREAGLRIY